MNTVPEVRRKPLMALERLAGLSELVGRDGYPIRVYLYTRALFLAIAIVDAVVRGWPLWHELSNWDGKWYVLTAQFGYPHVIEHHYSTLGFLPLYSMLIWPLAQVWPGHGYVPGGLIVSLVTGGVATVLFGRLFERWWGERASRRAVLFLCLFPGSIVFSMVYSEGLALMLIAGCLLALEDRRWVLAGLLGGLSTAIEPVAFAIIPVCAVVAGRELRRSGWQSRRALWAPLLSPLGAGLTAAFMWAWTGTPFAIYLAQQAGWRETSTPLGLYRDAHAFVLQLIDFRSFQRTPLNMNLPTAVLGGVFLLWALVMLWRVRASVPLGALVWSAGVALLTLSSNSTPPNPRLLLVAFPATAAVAVTRTTERGWRRLLTVTVLLTLVMSFDTFVGFGLRP